MRGQIGCATDHSRLLALMKEPMEELSEVQQGETQAYAGELRVLFEWWRPVHQKSTNRDHNDEQTSNIKHKHTHVETTNDDNGVSDKHRHRVKLMYGALKQQSRQRMGHAIMM